MNNVIMPSWMFLCWVFVPAIAAYILGCVAGRDAAIDDSEEMP